MLQPVTRLLCAALVLAALSAAETRPLIMGRRGVVVSGHQLASSAGLDVLKKGGNAVDAGVAAVLAQAVTEFDRFGLGGESPILIYLADRGEVVAINGNGPAPRAASIDWFEQRGIEAIPGDCFLAAIVPAAVDSLVLALAEYGTMSFAEVAAPAIDLAANGFPMYDAFRSRLSGVASRFQAEWPSSAEVFLPDGRLPDIGDLFIQKDLARTLGRLVEAEQAAAGDGREAGLQAVRDAFYRGEIAREAVEFQSTFECVDQVGTRSTGLLTTDDLAAYRARVEPPAKTTYRSVEVYKAGFWSQGPVLLQALNILEGYDLRSLGHNSAEYIHVLSEAMKLAYADREWYYADPNFVGVPEEGLLSKEYAAERRKLISLETPSLKLRPGNPYPFQSEMTAHAAPPESIGFRPDPPGTTGTRVADADGNVFSATPSGGWFPTSPIIPGLGFVLGTRAQAFVLDREASNRLAPGKQPRTTLTPSLAVHDGAPYLAWGTPGGDVQDQVNLQTFLNVVEFGMDVQTAVEAPFFQILDFPPSFFPRSIAPGNTRFENRIPPDAIQRLIEIGHTMRPARPWSIGDVTALRVDRERGVVFGAAGPRRNKSYAVAW